MLVQLLCNIAGVKEAESKLQARVYFAGATRHGDQVLTSGGRVLSVMVTDFSLEAAVVKAQQAALMVKFDGRHYRKDIGCSALMR